jgi:hypothetical protein
MLPRFASNPRTSATFHLRPKLTRLLPGLFRKFFKPSAFDGAQSLAWCTASASSINSVQKCPKTLNVKIINFLAESISIWPQIQVHRFWTLLYIWEPIYSQKILLLFGWLCLVYSVIQKSFQISNWIWDWDRYRNNHFNQASFTKCSPFQFVTISTLIQMSQRKVIYNKKSTPNPRFQSMQE